MRAGFLLGVALLLVCPLAAAAQEHPRDEVCAEPGVLPPELAGWVERASVNATPGAYDLAVAVLAVGEAVDATLKPVESVEFVVAPERWPEPETYAGMFSFHAPAAGTYRVALSDGAWIDMVAGDELVASTAFGGAPACTGVRKTVSFALQPGVHVLQISAHIEPEISVMVGYVP